MAASQDSITPSRSVAAARPITPSDADRREHVAVRRAFDIVANGFLAAFVAQVLLAGWSLFDEPARWDWHRSLGHTMEIVALALVVLGTAGRLPRPRRRLAVVLLALTIVQGALAGIGGAVGALHPANAFAIGLIGFRLAQRC